jgi:hypothetical protein
MRKAISLGERVRGEECATKALLSMSISFSFQFFNSKGDFTWMGNSGRNG